MTIETILRDALQDVAGAAEPVPGLAAEALRRARRRRTVVRGAMAAGAVVALAVPAALVAFGPDGDGAIPAAGAGILAAPEWRELTSDELATAFDACARGTLTIPRTVGMRPVDGITLVEPISRTATTWVLSRSADGERIECALDDRDALLSSEAVVEAQSASGPGVLFQGSAPGVGTYRSPVARVTVQAGAGPEQDAILREGFWFYPMVRPAADRACSSADALRRLVPEPDRADPVSVEVLPRGVTMRGYDQDGTEVWSYPGEACPWGD